MELSSSSKTRRLSSFYSTVFVSWLPFSRSQDVYWYSSPHVHILYRKQKEEGKGKRHMSAVCSTLKDLFETYCFISFPLQIIIYLISLIERLKILYIYILHQKGSYRDQCFFCCCWLSNIQPPSSLGGPSLIVCHLIRNRTLFPPTKPMGQYPSLSAFWQLWKHGTVTTIRQLQSQRNKT